MKVKLITLLLFISSSLSYSQIVKSIGFKSGITLSNQNWEYLRMNELFLFENLTGFSGTLTTDFIIKKYWDLSLDMGFYKNKSHGVHNPNSLTESSPDEIFRFGLVTFNPSIRLKLPFDSISFTPYIFTGPHMDYYYSKISNDGANMFKDQITTKPMWGFNIGIGISYKIKSFSISAEYQYLYSFNYMIDQPTMNTPIPNLRDRLKISTQLISLGFKYYLKKK